MVRSSALRLSEPPDASSRPAKPTGDPNSEGAGERQGRRPGRAGGRTTEAFDIWLQQGLHRLYDSVANEPIPDELLNLIEQDRIDRTE